MIDHRLYLVTDDPSRYRGDWLELIAAALDGGVTCVQYRDTENVPKVQYERIRQLQDLLKPRHIPLIVNNDAELAAAVKAEGVHVGQGDMPPAQVRQIVGPACEIGLSITSLGNLDAILRRRETPDGRHTVGDARHETGGEEPDVIGIGPIYDATKTKADAAKEMGLDGLAKIVAATPDMPNVAIGGITLERAPGILAAGAQGLAVVSALSQVPDPCLAAQSFINLFN